MCGMVHWRLTAASVNRYCNTRIERADAGVKPEGQSRRRAARKGAHPMQPSAYRWMMTAVNAPLVRTGFDPAVSAGEPGTTDTTTAPDDGTNP